MLPWLLRLITSAVAAALPAADACDTFSVIADAALTADADPGAFTIGADEGFGVSSDGDFTVPGCH